MSLITCRDVAFAYEGREVISGLNFTVKKGEYLCIVGENGSGKTTLVKGILQMKEPLKGELTFGDGLQLNEVGYLPQQLNVQRDFPASVWEVVLSGCLNSLGHRMFFNKKDKQQAEHQMKMLRIMNLRDACYRELSGGQRQRVLLARALCASQKLLLLDEPVTGLDPVVTAEFYELVHGINKIQGVAVIMVTHDIRGALEHADHILHLHNEQVFFGTTVAYKQSPMGKYFCGGGADA